MTSNLSLQEVLQIAHIRNAIRVRDAALNTANEESGKDVKYFFNKPTLHDQIKKNDVDQNCREHLENILFNLHRAQNEEESEHSTTYDNFNVKEDFSECPFSFQDLNLSCRPLAELARYNMVENSGEPRSEMGDQIDGISNEAEKNSVEHLSNNYPRKLPTTNISNELPDLIGHRLESMSISVPEVIYNHNEFVSSCASLLGAKIIRLDNQNVTQNEFWHAINATWIGEMVTCHHEFWHAINPPWIGKMVTCDQEDRLSKRELPELK